MKQPKISYIVLYLPSRTEFETRAVSEAQAINNIHYNLWFEEGIWTEMEDFVAVPEVLVRFKEKLNDERRDQTNSINEGCSEHVWNTPTEQYVQMSLSWS